MKIQIKNRWNDTVVFETDAENLGAAVVAAIAAKVNLSCANLSCADLSGANLSCANLSCANLSGANLRGANLRYANLRYANLSCADLSCANLSGANLRGANLRYANLSCADLSCANLSGANLRGANLRYANPSCADLSGANLRGAKMSKSMLESVVSQRTILPEGELIGYKKLQDGVICKLKIPAEAKRVGGLIGRKCRAEYAIVIEGEGESMRCDGTKYKPGKTIKPDKFDPDPTVECSNGIHFFITREEAEDYSG